MQLTKQKGFTLVEIAIVLVIVGLLIGGVLKGQEMITNAKLKRVESDNAGIAAAMFSYQDRYLQLPGDDSDAGSRFDAYAAPFTTADANGDGDGAIGRAIPGVERDALDGLPARKIAPHGELARATLLAQPGRPTRCLGTVRRPVGIHAAERAAGRRGG